MKPHDHANVDVDDFDVEDVDLDELSDEELREHSKDARDKHKTLEHLYNESDNEVEKAAITAKANAVKIKRDATIAKVKEKKL